MCVKKELQGRLDPFSVLCEANIWIHFSEAWGWKKGRLHQNSNRMGRRNEVGPAFMPNSFIVCILSFFGDDMIIFRLSVFARNHPEGAPKTAQLPQPAAQDRSCQVGEPLMCSADDAIFLRRRRGLGTWNVWKYNSDHVDSRGFSLRAQLWYLWGTNPLKSF